jgi:hypothetical protein
MLGEDPHASYRDLVVLKFKGGCEFNSDSSALPEPGALAFTYSVDGEIQPFGEVDCDRVVNLARNAMSCSDFNRADLLIGRALGRVVTHELVHMLTRSAEHGTEGVEKAALSGRQLIAENLSLSAFDRDRLRPKFQQPARRMSFQVRRAVSAPATGR